MAVTVLLEIRFKPESLAEGTEVMRRELVKTRAFGGNVLTEVWVDEADPTHWVIYEVWESIASDEAYRAFRDGDGAITDLPPLLAGPLVKTRFSTSDV